MHDKKHILDLIKLELGKRHVELFEIFLHFTHSTAIECKNREIDGLKVSSDVGVGLRVLLDKHPGFSYTNDPCSSSVESLVENAVGNAKISNRDVAYDFTEKPDKPYETCDIYDAEFEQHQQEEKVDRALELERAALETDPAIRQVRKATYAESQSETLIVNSKGLYSNYRSTISSAMIMVMAEKNSNAEIGWYYDFSHFYKDLNIEKVGRKAARRALQKLGGKSVPTQRSFIIVDEEPMTEFLDVLAPSFYGDNVKKGKSLLAKRMGEKILPQNISIYDDGLYPSGMDTAPFDGEGIPSQKTPLVENGILSNFLFDLFWGNRTGRSSTGNAVRNSYKTPPSIGRSNFYLKANRTESLDWMIQSVRKGLLVRELIGVHTANPISGEFSLGATGLWIENGEVKFPVKGITISGNLLKMLDRIEAVGDRIRFFGSTGAPVVLVRDIQISGT